MKHLLLCGILFTAFGCSSSAHESAPGDAGQGGAATKIGTGGGTGTGGVAGTGGGAATGGTAGSGAAECAVSNFSSAPLECSQDWTHAVVAYPHRCTAVLGGYEATCAPYDAIVFNGPSTETWCFYSDTTGNLIGWKVTTGSVSSCNSVDFKFALPKTNDCAPVSTGSNCGSDSGLIP